MTQGNERPASADLDAKIAQLKAEHGAVVVIDTRFGKLVFKPPHHADFERFIDRISSDKNSKIAAARELCQMCVVHPSLDEARVIFQRLPAIPPTIVVALGEIAGNDIEAVVQKM